MTYSKQVEPEAWFWSKVEIGAPNECWPWTAGCNRDGYGRFSVDGKSVPAHRVAWELTHDTVVPEGLVVCHKCNGRSCMSPDHLFVTTRRGSVETMIRKGHPWWKDITHCPQGHKYTRANTYWYMQPSGRRGRQCRKCRRAEKKATRARRQADRRLQRLVQIATSPPFA